jgi:pimeloyl-ACP methyl ester carboxylesterase
MRRACGAWFSTGVAPPAMIVSLDVWRTRDAALTDVINACRKSTTCSAAHPDPAATLAAIANDLGPDGKTIVVPDPRTGEPMSVRVSVDLVIGALQPLTYVPELSSLIPQLLDHARRGDYAPLIATVDMVTGNLAEQMNAALHYSVTCAEDVPRIGADDRTKALAGLRAESLAHRVIAVCDVWPRGAVPADFTAPVKSDVPVLILSGALDPVTPPVNGDVVAKTLPNSRHVIATGMGHIVSSHGCVPRLVASFVDSASVADLPSDCIDRLARGVRPPMWPDRLAPQP